MSPTSLVLYAALFGPASTALAFPPAASQLPSPADALPGRFGEALDQWELGAEPVDAAWGPDGAVWVLEARPPRLVLRSAAGEELRGFGLELERPAALAAGAEDSVWVLDAGRLDVRRISAAGEVLQATELGPLAVAPADLVALPGGVAVADPGAHVVLVLRTLGLEVIEEGRPVAIGPTALGRRGTGAGEFLEPMGLAYDAASGELLVADAGNHRIQRFDAELQPVGAFGEFGPFPGLFARPVGLELAGGRLYVVEEQNHRVQVFDWATPGNAPERLYEWGIHVIRPGAGRGRLHYPRGIAVRGERGEDGAFTPAAALVTEPFADRLQLFGPAAKPASAYMNDPAVTGGKVSAHLGPAVAAAGSLGCLIEPESQELRLLDLRHPVPIEIGRFGGQGDGRGKFRGLIDVAFGPCGENGEPDRLFALDALTGRLSELPFEFDPEAEPGFSYERLRFGRGLELFALHAQAQPLALASAGDSGELAVLDGHGDRVHWFSSGLQALATRPAGEIAADRGPGTRPLALVLSGDGARATRIEGGARAIVVERDGDGPPQTTALEAELSAVGGFAALPEGFAVTDTAGHALVWLDAEFREIGRLGGAPGLEREALRRPRGLAVDGSGRLLVLDHGNHRLKVLGPDREIEGAFGPRLYIQSLR